MNNVDNLMNIMIFACGAYTIYSAIIMMTKGEIKKWLLGDKTDIKKCRDVPGFINYIAVKTLILGIFVLIFSIIGFVNTFFIALEKELLIGATVILFIFLVIFSFIYIRARKKYLD